MQVFAVSTPTEPGWRWRIMNHAGEILEESTSSFPTIATAVAEGVRRMGTMNLIDRSVRPKPFGRGSHTPRMSGSTTTPRSGDRGGRR